MFDLDRFIADCITASAETSHQPIRDVVARAVADPTALMATLGEPSGAGVTILHRTPTLTILNLVWGPGQMTTPHNHHMWAAIGLYGGREDNIYWKANQGEPGLSAAAARSLGVGETELLGRDIIHSVINPLQKLTGAIHVYGGDLITAEREEWEAEQLRMQPFDGQKSARSFADANARWQAMGAG